MISRIVCLFLLLGYGTVQAHQPDVSSTILAENGENKWVLQVRAAMTAFEYEIHHHYGKDSYATPEEFQDLVINYVKENISILFDGATKVELKNGMVKLGHETNAVFEVTGIPENFKKVNFKNSTFKDIYHNQSALIFLKKGFSKNQFILNNENEHTAHLELRGTELIALDLGVKKAMAMPNTFMGLGLLGIVGLLMLFFFRRRKVEVSPE